MSYIPNTKNQLHSTNLITMYPKYSYLSSFINSWKQYNNINKANVFFDVKNILGLCYIDQIMCGLYNNTYLYNTVDLSIFISFLNHLKRMKDFFYTYFEDVNFIYFMDNGESYYHTTINKQYKGNRTIQSDLNDDILKGFFEIYHTNLNIVDNVLNKINSTYIIQLKNLEADFIPFYLVKNNYFEKNAFNLIFSNDKDMFQNTNFENFYCYTKNYFKKIDKIISNDIVYNTYLKKDELLTNKIINKYFDLLLAIAGDASDGIIGLKGVGPKRSFDIINILNENNILLDDHYLFIKDIYEDENNIISKIKDIKHDSKYMKKFIDNIDKVINNLKLTSYDYLSLWFDSEDDKKNKSIINDRCNKKEYLELNEFEQLMKNIKIPNEVFEESKQIFKY